MQAEFYAQPDFCLSAGRGSVIFMVSMEQKIRAIMKVSGQKQLALAEHFGVSQSTVHRWLKGAEPEGPHRDAINDLYEDVIDEPERENGQPATVKLIGYVSAGATAHYDIADLGYVPAPTNATPSTVAMEIRGDSLGAAFKNWLVYYDDDQVRSPVTPDMIGRLCVVGLPNGQILVKTIESSRTPGLYHLLSNTEGPILDVEIAWAAKVKGMLPR